MREIISSIDIGTDKIKLVVGEYLNNDFNILCALEENTVGFENYNIINEYDLIKSIKRIIDQANRKLNFKLKKIIVNIPTNLNDFIISDTTLPIKNEDLTVSSQDILKVIKNTAYNKININNELISAIPIYFRVGDNETKDPFNKKGKKISAKTVLVTANKREVYDIISIIVKCGLEVIDITSTGLVDYYNFRNDYLDNKTGIIVNIGHSKTQVSVFSKGIYINNEVLPVGGININKDIAFIYKVKRNDAYKLKENLALANIRRASPKEKMTLTNKVGEKLDINQYELTEIVSSRVIEILKLVKNSINHLTKKKISYIIITGGLTELKDFNISLTSIFGDTAQIGIINNLGARNNKYSVCIGMIEYFKDKLRLRHRKYSTVGNIDSELMCNTDTKISGLNDSILGKVFGYFFDN
ncbi:MAG: cell division FtsA domain-containing protein [Bacilli bacterium]|nr:cell division FtsA domain-containing protein [Bacilli bacterium]